MGPGDGDYGPGPDRPLPVRVLSASGEVVVTGSVLETVEELRSRAAASLGIPVGLIVLLQGSQELLDGQTLGEPPDASTLDVALVRLPCQARSEEYGSFIARCDPHELLPDPADERRILQMFHLYHSSDQKTEEKALVRLGAVEFPEPRDIDINMMPFVIGEKASIPEEYRQYWPVLERCKCLQLQRGKIGYLTIHESLVQRGETQRRPGLHVETSCVLAHGGRTCVCHPWGEGQSADGFNLLDGIYMASTVASSSRVWDVKLRSPERVVGHLGDVEHLRHLLGEGSLMGAGELFWITDTTPHESVPLAEGAYRQYFRLVSSSVSVWYEKHSTKNRLGIAPDPAETTVLSDDKFDGSFLGRLAGRCASSPPPVVHGRPM